MPMITKDHLSAHFPREDDVGFVWCACETYTDSVNDEGTAERWATHVVEAGPDEGETAPAA